MSRTATEQPRAVWCCSACGAIYHRDFPRCPADGAEVVMTTRDPLLDTTVGNYVIDRLIGEGGMGRVYLARHANLPNKRYAFKVLLGDHAASTAMRHRFAREAERASQLDHPNVVKVVDFGQTKLGLLYIVMDYVDGPSLVGLIGELPMAPSQVVRLAREICKGLLYAHDAGIVHRDLKPENILVADGPDGPVPRIVDFGLALSIDQSDPRLTESGMTMGTPLFAAPEQLLGHVLDHRADQYALGMTMFEMLTGGMMPISGTAMEVMSAKTIRDTPRLTERLPGLAVPPELEDIVARLTRRKPEERYPGDREVIEALDRVPFDRSPDWRRRIEARSDAKRLATPSAGRESLMPLAPTPFGYGGRTEVMPSAVGAVDRAAQAPPNPAAPVEGSRRWRRRGSIAAGSISAVAFVAWLAVSIARDPPAPAVSSVASAAPESAPVAIAAPPPPAAPAAKAAVANDADEIDMSVDAEPAAPVNRRPRQRDRELRAAAPAAVPAAPAIRRPPPAVPRELRVQIDRVEVSGSLPVGTVQRAIERRRSAIESCMPRAPGTVVARFTISETRRAQGVRAVGSTATTSACVGAALRDVRTDNAPDIGDVEVTVRIGFVDNP